MGKKVLFISHNAGRNGAPLMLLNLLRWLKGNTDLSLEVLLRATGPLHKDFAALAPTFLYQAPSPRGPWGVHFKSSPGVGPLLAKSHQRRLLGHFRNSGISLVYSNTFTNGEILQTLAPLECPVITHAHEMEGWIRQAGEKNLGQILRFTSHFIAASEACRRNLIVSHRIPGSKVDTVHSFIPIQGINADPAGIRARMGIPEESFVVLGSGHEFWRKGKDLFVQLAARMRKTLPERQVHFVWVGGWLRLEDRMNLMHDVRHLELSDRIHFTGEVANPLDYFASGDVFALVSREDTFPLVCLEAAALGKPVLCFAGAGGMPEFVKEDAGFVLPYLDLEAMAAKIADLAKDPEMRKRLGERAAGKVRQRCDVAAGSRRIEEIIRRFL